MFVGYILHRELEQMEGNVNLAISIEGLELAILNFNSSTILKFRNSVNLKSNFSCNSIAKKRPNLTDFCPSS